LLFRFAVECAIGNIGKELKGLELNVSNWVLDYADTNFVGDKYR